MNQRLTEEKSIYLQISQMIETDILRGVLLEEERVPSTNELAKLYTINPATAAKGINLLVEAGILYKKRGIGMSFEPFETEYSRDQKRSDHRMRRFSSGEKEEKDKGRPMEGYESSEQERKEKKEPAQQVLQAFHGWPSVILNGELHDKEYNDFVTPGREFQDYPCTLVGVTKDGKKLFIITADKGSMVEDAYYLVEQGAWNVVNFDGGGSATMVVYDEVVNSPTAPNPRSRLYRWRQSPCSYSLITAMEWLSTTILPMWSFRVNPKNWDM